MSEMNVMRNDMVVLKRSTISHPELKKKCFIDYQPDRTDCFRVDTGFYYLNPKEMRQFLELVIGALTYHKLSQEEKHVPDPVTEEG